MPSLFCGFPLGHNGNSAVKHQTLMCYLMPESLKNKNSVHESRSLPPRPHPPSYTAWLQNMQTDRASLDSPVCVPASDASPQLQTNSVGPAHYSSCCRLTQGSVYLNTVTDIYTFACTHQRQTCLLSCQLFILFDSFGSANKDTHPFLVAVGLQFIKNDATVFV